MDYRHEWKIAIDAADLVALRSRLRVLMQQDPHAAGGRYQIRSLYFDGPTDRALQQKIDGVDRREKFRIRYYNGDTGFLKLEKKCKRGELCSKYAAPLTGRQVQAILDGGALPVPPDAPPLLQEFLCKMHTQGLRPKVVVEYTREPFICPAGDVRVTFDYGLRTGLRCTDFLDPELVTIPPGDAPILMEVKWGAFLPEVIRDAIQMPGCRAGAFSKYAQCRLYD